MKKTNTFYIAGGFVALAMATFVASPAAAVSSVSFSASTICPGESVTFTANGISNGSVVNLEAGETARVTIGGSPFSNNASISTGTFTYSQLVNVLGTGLDLVEIIDGSNTVLNSASVDILAECVAPEPQPDPEPKTLADTGVNGSELTSLGGLAAVVTLAGASLVIVRRRKARS